MTTSPGYEDFDPRFATFVDTSRAPEAIADRCGGAEGPVWLDGGLFFNDLPNKRMLRWTEATGVRVALANSEFATGNTRDANGRMVSCEHGGRRVIRRRDPYDFRAVELLAATFEDKRLNGPKDVVVRSDGAVWFTDPTYGISSDAEGYRADSQISGRSVYCLAVDGRLTAAATDFDQPNGLAFSPDETKLYVADSGALSGGPSPQIDPTRPHHIRVFDVDGAALSGGAVFRVVAPGAPGGLRVDHEGVVWTSAQDGVHCLSPEGELLGKIRLPARTSNLCFGGEDGQTLFITAADKVYRVRSTRADAAQVRLEAIRAARRG